MRQKAVLELFAGAHSMILVLEKGNQGEYREDIRTCQSVNCAARRKETMKCPCAAVAGREVWLKQGISNRFEQDACKTFPSSPGGERRWYLPSRFLERAFLA